MLSPCANHGTLHEDKAGQEKYSEGGLPVILCCCSTCTLTKLHTSIEQTFTETPLGRPFQFVMEWRELEDRFQSLGEVSCFFDADGRKRCHDSLLLLFCSPFPFPLVTPPNGTKSCYLFLRQSPDRLYKPLMPRLILGKHFLPVYEWPKTWDFVYCHGRDQTKHGSKQRGLASANRVRPSRPRFLDKFVL